MKKDLILILLSGCILYWSSSIYALETSGYFRSGVVQPGQDACFKLPGARTKYRLGNECDTYLEVGHDQVLPLASSLRVLNKASLALQWAKSKGFWQRPVYRAYVSYADWNQAALDAGLAGGITGPYSTASEGLMMGLQVEVWW